VVIILVRLLLAKGEDPFARREGIG
jgi:hypothetical protein